MYLNTKKKRSDFYKKYLESEYWQNVKYKVLLRDRFKCCLCDSRKFLNVHHIAYTVNRENIIRKELQYLDWLVVLCNDCHEKVHSNVHHKFNPNNKNKICRK